MRSRSAGSSGGIPPAAAFAAACVTDVVAGMATVTRGSARHQRRRASGQPERPAAASSAGNDRRSRDPRPAGASRPRPARAPGRAAGSVRAFVLDRVEGRLDGVDPSRSHHRLELAERRRLVRRRAQPADGPAARSRSIQSRCDRQATRLWTCSRSTRPNHRSWSANWRGPSAASDVQILVATIDVGAPGLDRRTEARLRPPVHRRAVDEAHPAVERRRHDRVDPACRSAGTSNVRHEPRPTTGTARPVAPRARVSTNPPYRRSRPRHQPAASVRPMVDSGT